MLSHERGRRHSSASPRSPPPSPPSSSSAQEYTNSFAPSGRTTRSNATACHAGLRGELAAVRSARRQEEEKELCRPSRPLPPLLLLQVPRGSASKLSALSGALAEASGAARAISSAVRRAELRKGRRRWGEAAARGGKELVFLKGK